MDPIINILRAVPLFRHCSDDEIVSLRKIGRHSIIKKGQLFDLKKISSFSIVIDGIFEIEALGRSDIVYLAPGSFFGNVPFTDNRLGGTIRAMVDSTLLLFQMEELYKFYLLSYKCLKGYLKIVDRMGFEINEIARKCCDTSSSVIAVYSTERNAGKTLFASALGIALSTIGKTIALDLSYDGNSLFDFFEKKITPPLSQRMKDGVENYSLIRERIVQANEAMDLLNIAHGSKVRVKGEILPPILFVLSQEYRYIILDISEGDSLLRDRCFELSDRIFCLLKNVKEKQKFFQTTDSLLRDGQRVYYVLNEFYARGAKSFSGGFMLEKCEGSRAFDMPGTITGMAECLSMKNIVSLFQRKSRALVFESNFLEASYFSGILSSLKSSGATFDVFYSSSLSYVLIAMYSLIANGADYKKKVVSLFSENTLSSFLDITFPSDHVFKINAVSKFAQEIAGSVRLEEMSTLPMALLCEAQSGNRGIMSTGFAHEVMAASFSLFPLFEAQRIAGVRCGSGFPDRVAHVEDLLRTDVQNIYFISAMRNTPLEFSGGRVIPFFKEYLQMLSSRNQSDKVSELADDTIVIELDLRELKAEKILRLTEDMANKLLKEKKWI